MEVDLEDEMKKITDTLGRSTTRSNPGLWKMDIPGQGVGATQVNNLAPSPANTLLNKLALMRGKVAEFDADIRNDLSDLDADLGALHANISARIGTR